MDSVTLKRFDTPDETRVLVKGTFELIHIGGMTIGRAAVPPDSWVIGDEPYVSLHFLGAERDATK